MVPHVLDVFFGHDPHEYCFHVLVPELRAIEFGYHFLLKFLRAGNHDIDYATQILLNYIRQFNIGPKYTKNVLNMDVIRRVYEDKIGTLLPHRDKYGRRVYFYRPGKWDPDTVCLDDCYCAGYMLCEAAAREPMSQVCGVTVICDAANFGFKQLRQFSIEDIKAFSTFMQVSLFYCARYLNKELFKMFPNLMKTRVVNNYLNFSGHFPFMVSSNSCYQCTKSISNALYNGKTVSTSTYNRRNIISC